MTTTDAPRRGRKPADLGAVLGSLDNAQLIAALRTALANNEPPEVPANGKGQWRQSSKAGVLIHETTAADGTKRSRVMPKLPRLPGLRYVREARALTQVQLADAASVDPLTVSRLENQRNPARAPTMNRLARVLSVDPRILTKFPPGEGVAGDGSDEIQDDDIKDMVPSAEARQGY